MTFASVCTQLVLRVVAISLLLVPSAAQAREAWLLGFHTEPIRYPGEPDCEALQWQDKEYFFNSKATPAVVRLLGISNGPKPVGAQDITIPANSLFATSISQPPFRWDPCVFSCDVTIFVAHVDIPEGVLISSRAEVVSSLFTMPDTICPLPGFTAKVFAGQPLVVKLGLAPAGSPQYHLGIDIGTDTDGDSGAAGDTRASIGVYNQASVVANATIETRRGCDDALIERRNLTIPPNTVFQFGGFSTDTSGCGAGIKTPRYAVYAIVTVDQPGFSYAISLRNDMLPTFVGTSPMTQ
jgi:hypothetical protein